MKMEVAPDVFSQQIHRLNVLLEKQVAVVDRLLSNCNRSPFILRKERERMFDLEDQIQELEKLQDARQNNISN